MNTSAHALPAVDRNRPIKQLSVPFAIAAVLLALAVTPQTRAQERNDKSEEVRQTAAELATVRARVIRENPEAAKIHARILRLYSELDRVLSKHPEIQRLRHRLDTLLPEQAPLPSPDATNTPTPGDSKP